MLNEERKKELGYELDRIINVLRKDIKIKLIMLFGSLARGDINRMSDIDMIIVKEPHSFSEPLKIVKVPKREGLYYMKTEVFRGFSDKEKWQNIA